MEYVLIFNQPIEVTEMQEDPVKGPASMEAWRAYMGELGAAGVMRGGNRLHRAQARWLSLIHI